LISVAFAVLFIGLGVDYAVHVILRFWEERHWHHDVAGAAAAAASHAGPALLICTVTTSLSFLAFVPTDFVGMSQLGIIAAGGVVIAFVASLTLVPAVLALLPLPTRSTKLPRQAAITHHPAWYHARLATTVFTMFVAVAAVILLPSVRFDGDPVDLKDPESPPVIAFKQLLKTKPGEAYAANVLARDEAAARALAARLDKLAEVREVRTAQSFLPPRQGEKRQVLAGLEGLVPSVVATLPMPAPGARRAAFEELKQALQGLEQANGTSPRLKEAAHRLRAGLLLFDADNAASDDRLAALEQRLFAGLPQLVHHLNGWVNTPEVTVASLPAEIRDRYVAPDGRWRLEVLPAGAMAYEVQLDRFVAAVTSLAPHATGAPVEIVGAADVVSSAMRTAVTVAFGLLLVVLIALLRRPLDVLLVLTPLVLAALLLLAYTVIFHAPFNFANVIVLPLLLGLGVDANVHYVLRAREEQGSAEVTDTSTPRAVLIAALTTIGSFGTLWLSPHRGMSSMGELLTVAIAITLVCTLVVLPQLIGWTIGRDKGRP